MIRSIVYFVPAVLWVLFIGWLCFTPAEKITPYDWFDLFQFDKLGHAAIFGILVWLMLYAFLKQNFSIFLAQKALWIATLFAIVYSGVIEIIQENFIPTRSGEWIDFVADLIGCLVSIVVFKVFMVFFQDSIKS